MYCRMVNFIAISIMYPGLVLRDQLGLRPIIHKFALYEFRPSIIKPKKYKFTYIYIIICVHTFTIISLVTGMYFDHRTKIPTQYFTSRKNIHHSHIYDHIYRFNKRE